MCPIEEYSEKGLVHYPAGSVINLQRRKDGRIETTFVIESTRKGAIYKNIQNGTIMSVLPGDDDSVMSFIEDDDLKHELRVISQANLEFLERFPGEK